MKLTEREEAIYQDGRKNGAEAYKQNLVGKIITDMRQAAKADKLLSDLAASKGLSKVWRKRILKHLGE